MVPPFEGLDGVIEIKSGYIGGRFKKPTYEQVCTGNTGHYEAVQITYDPSQISYRHLLDIFWKQINPEDAGGQFYDRGSQYKTAIFYYNDEQKRLAEESKLEIEKSGRFNGPISTRILNADDFFTAEEYHQDYHRKEPEHYKNYRKGSGRDAYLKSVWGDKTND